MSSATDGLNVNKPFLAETLLFCSLPAEYMDASWWQPQWLPAALFERLRQNRRSQRHLSTSSSATSGWGTTRCRVGSQPGSNWPQPRRSGSTAWSRLRASPCCPPPSRGCCAAGQEPRHRPDRRAGLSLRRSGAAGSSCSSRGLHNRRWMWVSLCRTLWIGKAGGSAWRAWPPPYRTLPRRWFAARN